MGYGHQQSGTEFALESKSVYRFKKKGIACDEHMKQWAEILPTEALTSQAKAPPV